MWISVKDGMPGDEEVITYSNNDGVISMLIQPYDWDYMRWDDDDDFITHWQPLPLPPTSDNNDCTATRPVDVSPKSPDGDFA